jgi:hypothetical protein
MNLLLKYGLCDLKYDRVKLITSTQAGSQATD